MKKIEDNSNRRLRIRVRLRFFYFILNSPPLAGDITYSVTLLARKKYEEVTSDEHPRILLV